MEQLKLEGTSVNYPVQSHLLRAASAGAGCPVPRPVRFWLFPRMETPQPP